MSMFKMAWGSAELIDLYNRLSSGHFFDRDTMRFFKSRVTSNFRRIDDKTALFITTERGPLEGSKRNATLRIARLVEFIRESDGRTCQRVEIRTVGGFNIKSIRLAVSQMRAWSELDECLHNECDHVCELKGA